jgi:hypothetical protein
MPPASDVMLALASMIFHHLLGTFNMIRSMHKFEIENVIRMGFAPDQQV